MKITKTNIIALNLVERMKRIIGENMMITSFNILIKILINIIRIICKKVIV